MQQIKSNLQQVLNDLRNIVNLAQKKDIDEELIIQLKACWADIAWVNKNLNLTECRKCFHDDQFSNECNDCSKGSRFKVKEEHIHETN